MIKNDIFIMKKKYFFTIYNNYYYNVNLINIFDIFFDIVNFANASFRVCFIKSLRLDIN